MQVKDESAKIKLELVPLEQKVREANLARDEAEDRLRLAQQRFKEMEIEL